MTENVAQSDQSPAQVVLVGAGPGDPALITRAGLDALRRADAVVYDALASPELLSEAPPHAELFDVGKRARRHKLTQDQINDLLLQQARKGRYVVRLKGGDPYLFGRGAEEAIFLGRHGVTVRVIPGVTSGIAAPAAAGIPVTHREHASAVTFVTGHEDPAKPDSSINYTALAQLITAGGTVCFYMGVKRWPDIAAALTDGGLDPHTPAAAIQWGTLPRQQHVKAKVSDLKQYIERAGLAAPAILVVGAVAGLDEPGLDWFTTRPLFGQRVLITRTRHQASTLLALLEERGAEVIEAPTIELHPPDDLKPINQTITHISQYDWLILTSANGVDALAQRLEALNLDARHLAGVRIAAIGDATAHALRQRLAITADLVPTRYVAESLAAELIAREDLAQKRCLLLRADIARPKLPELLQQAGAQVSDLPVYHTVRTDCLPDEALEALRARSIDWITFTSASAVTNLLDLLGQEAHLLTQARLASIGPITSARLRELGHEPAVEPATSNIPSLVEAIESTRATG